MTRPQDSADLILELRQRLELTQEQFAAHLGVTFPTVNRWENRRAKPSRLALQSIRGLLEQMGESGQDLLTKYFSS
ncbi:helix-turn-helix domain-containing protein [Egbenema bharatensis]|uniref:helix-turn-helix domain-containing protein n=1 Tax=Egbenema bharatensis TaxID=3463334 RepID=UPI003A8C313B